MIIREAKVEHNIKVNPHFESKKFTVARNLDDDPRKIYLDDAILKILFDLDVPNTATTGWDSIRVKTKKGKEYEYLRSTTTARIRSSL